MNSFNFSKVIKSALFVLGAQLLILLISTIRSLILPSFFDIESYGYWQLYLFYSAYVLIFAFGFNDGIYLRYGSKDYKELPFAKLRTSIRIFSLMSFFITLLVVYVSYLIDFDPNTRFAMVFSGLNIFVLGLTGVFTYVFQITNQLKKYSFFSVADKILVLITIGFMFIVNNTNFKLIIVVDFLAKLLVLTVMIYKCKELWLGENISISNALKEFKANISVGVKLLIANLLGMLIIGLGRFMIQIFGSIEDFATYSFGITITGLILTAITSFSLVLYPILKRMDKNNYSKYFKHINNALTSFNFFALLLYYPAYWGVIIFYNKFSELLPYLNLLFVIVILQGKMSVLNNTFYKVLRKEKEMLIANVSSVLFFVIFSSILFYFMESIWSIAFSTFVTMITRVYASEIYLKKQISIKFENKLFFEVLYIFIFIVTTSFIDLELGLLLFTVLFFIWISLNFNNLIKIKNLITR